MAIIAARWPICETVGSNSDCSTINASRCAAQPMRSKAFRYRDFQATGRSDSALLANDMQWRYHLGFHKTATTHLQKTLEASRSELAEKRIAYIPLHDIRAATAPILKRQKRLRKWRFRNAVKKLAPGADIVIVSEENLLGYPRDACTFPLYPGLEGRLSCLPRSECEAFLAVRNPADFATSIYSEAMRHDPHLISLEETRQAFLAQERPWTDVIERIRRFFPNLRIWKYDDYRTNETGFASLVAGVPIAALPIADPSETKRLPAQTIELLEKMRADDGSLDTKAEDLPLPEQPERFEMFTAAERDVLNGRYESELKRLSDIIVAPPS